MKFLEKLLRGVVLTGVFILPLVALIVADGLFFPYITGKNFTYRIVIELMTGAWLSLVLLYPQYRPKRNWILAAFSVFVLIIAIADAFGVYPFKSFMSNFERMDGWITIAHLLLYIVVAAAVLNTEKLWNKLFEWSLAISGFISILGFLQVANILALGAGSGNTGLAGRIDATFGNPIYLAGYMLFQIFFAALLWVHEGKDRWRGFDRALLALAPFIGFLVVGSQLDAMHSTLLFLWTILFIAVVELITVVSRRWLFAFIIAIDTIALLFTGTRGTTLGLVGGAVLALIVFAFSREASKRFRNATAGALILIVVLSVGLVAARNTSFVQHVGFLQRLSSISLNDDTVHARLLNMGIAWQGVKERPVLGWGQENYAIVFDKYYDPRMYAQEQWFDRVHDIIFDWWIAGGTLGLLSYLSIFVSALYVLWKRQAFGAAERAIFIGLLAGYFIHNLAVFDNITSYILFGTLLAYLVYRDSARPLWERASAVPEDAGWYLALVTMLIAVVAAWVINAGAISENLTLLSALESQPQGPSQNLALFQQAIGYDTIGTQEAREQLSQIAVQLSQSNVSNDLKQQFAITSVQQLDQQAKASPLDARFPLFAGSVLDAYGDYQDAWNELSRAHALSPRKQSIMYEMIQNAEARGDLTEATSFAKEAYELDTQDNQALLEYITTLVRAGEGSQAMTLWAQYVSKNPTDGQAYFTLAGAYYQAGNSAQAIAVLKEAAQAVTSTAPQAQQLIQQIKAAGR